MRELFILSIVLVYLLAAGGTVYAQSASLTATVRANPLEVEVFTPSSVSAGQWFDIKAEISNLGTETVTKTSVLISTPSKFNVRGKRKRIGSLVQGATETITWRARANSSGNFLILVEANGRLAGEKISISDSILISANGPLSAFLLRLFFRV